MTDYKKILHEELIPALGCTEPIAIALTAAVASDLTHEEPLKIDVYASGAIIKNANSVYVPNSGGLQGVLISAALGALVKHPENNLRVLEGVTDAMRKKAVQMIENGDVVLHHIPNLVGIHIKVDIVSANHNASATIEKSHTNVTNKMLDGQVLFSSLQQEAAAEDLGRDHMSLNDIYRFATDLNLEQNKDLTDLLDRMIETNTAISREGLTNPWGQEVGKTLMETANGNPEQEAVAYAAAGSDARMAGCDMPVTINAGSGNQGMTCSLPVIRMAKALGKSKEQLYRALLMSTLTTLYQKHYIGKLSAFCGAIAAAAGAGCGIAYLKGMSLDEIGMVLTNTIAASGGVICDGAKGSCALKIATGLQNAFVGIHMAEKGRVFQPHDGIVGRDADTTVRNIGSIAADGMVVTDKVILNIMTSQANQGK